MEMTRIDWKILGLLAVFSTVVLFFISQDSYLYDLHSRTDSAFFYMCGKAWMNGLIPYVDFSDSKGPLLWLIYGIGYLVKPTSYIGVFWITCIWYSLTYFISYKIAKIFLNDSFKAFACTLIMTLAFFNPWFHDEIRAEDFCLLFMNLSLYRVCLMMYGDRASKRTILSSFAILGFCFGALIMIKYSVAAMQTIFIICAIIVLLKNHISWWKPFLYGVLGFLSITLPFIILFLIKGNLAPFIQEYFVKSMQTVGTFDPNWCPRNILLTDFHPDSTLMIYLLEWADLVYNPEILAAFVALIFGGWLFFKKNKDYRWMPLLATCFVFALSVRHHTDYYFTICSFLFIFVLISLFEGLKIRPERRFWTVLCSVLVAAFIIPFHFLTYSFKVSIFNDNINQKDFYKVSYIMSQIERPKIVNAYGYEQGFGILSESLPAGKYWARQNGMTKEMIRQHEELILSGKADFIIIEDKNLEDVSRIQETQLNHLGYKEYLRFGKGEDFILFSNKDGLRVKEEATPSRVSLFLKRISFQ